MTPETLLAALKAKPMTRKEVEAHFGVSLLDASHMLSRLKEHKLVHFGAWKQYKNNGRGNQHAPVYYVGNKPDAPRNTNLDSLKAKYLTPEPSKLPKLPWS